MKGGKSDCVFMFCTSSSAVRCCIHLSIYLHAHTNCCSPFLIIVVCHFRKCARIPFHYGMCVHVPVLDVSFLTMVKLARIVSCIQNGDVFCSAHKAQSIFLSICSTIQIVCVCVRLFRSVSCSFSIHIIWKVFGPKKMNIHLCVNCTRYKMAQTMKTYHYEDGDKTVGFWLKQNGMKCIRFFNCYFASLKSWRGKEAAGIAKIKTTNRFVTKFLFKLNEKF